MNKVLLIKGFSQYNLMRFWVDSLAIGFEKLNIEVDIIDFKYVDLMYLEKLIVHNNYDAIIGFNGWLMGEYNFKNVKCPYIFILIDHPIDHIDRINNLEYKDILTIIDRNDIYTIDKFCNMPNNVFLLPHAAQEVNYEQRFDEKMIDVLFSGSYSDPEEIRRDWLIHPILLTIFDEVVNRCLLKPQNYYILEFEKVMKEKGVFLDFKEDRKLVILVQMIGRYIYSKRRELVLKEILDSGISVDIYGTGWENSSFINYPNLTLHQSVSYWALQDIMKKSKIILNIAGIANDGTHERVFAGMSNQSIVLTNETPYLNELFEDSVEVIFYNFSDISSVPAKINELLSSNEEMNKISYNAMRAILNQHTWNERAKEITEIFYSVYPQE